MNEREPNSKEHKNFQGYSVRTNRLLCALFYRREQILGLRPAFLRPAALVHYTGFLKAT